MRTLDAKRHDRAALEAELKLAGATIRGATVKCPFHDDRHPSASIYQDPEGIWRYKCQSSECGFGGDLFDVRARATGRDVADILRDERPAAPMERTEKVYPTIQALRSAVSAGGKIEAEYPYINPTTGKPDLVVFRIQTPRGKSFRQASPVRGGWVMRAPAKPWPLYRRKEIADAPIVFVVEGEKCCHALAEIGITNVTTTPAGAGHADHCDLSPLAGKQVYLWPDADSAGIAHMKQVMALLEKLKPACDIRVIDPSTEGLSGKEDVCDWIEICRSNGVDPLDRLDPVCAYAKTFTLSSGLKDRIEATIDGTWKDVAWPWPKLTRLSRALLPQTVSILCGTPGSAKSFFLLASMMRWFDEGIPFACYELEEDRTYHLDRVLALREGDVNLLDPEFVRDNPEVKRAAYERHRAYLDQFGRHIWDAPVEAPTLDGVTAWIRQRAIEGNRVIAVDPITSADEGTDKTWIADKKFVNAVKAIVRSSDTSLLIVTHPKKGSKVASLDDLAGGASYQRLSQCVLWLERHRARKRMTVAGECGRCEVDIDTTLHISKARNGKGHGYGIGFKIDWPTLCFSETGVIIEDAK